MKFSAIVALSMALAVSARPKYLGRRQDFKLKNGQDAIALNQQFATLTPTSACTTGEQACVNDQFAQCVNGKFQLQPCAAGTICVALPLVNSAGTSVTCDTAADRDARIAATGATAGAASAAPPPPASSAAAPPPPASSAAAPPPPASSSAAPPATSSTAAGNNAGNTGAAAGDPQTSTTLLASVIATGFAQNGQAQADPGQVPSLTSTNNFINFCATSNKAITNGQQIKEGSCNPAPMGEIASFNNMPSSKFVNPKNNGKVAANQNFTIQMAVKNLETGSFVNANTNFFAAPQQVNAQGNIRGHSHVVVEKIDAIDSTAPTDPTTFAFFKGLNAAADANGILSVVVPGGLPAGVYRLASINSAANHQPALVAVAQHGALDDMVYFTVA
ncbi:hypothetical protein LXA43DRAFT_621416 [Ganoderma leucocontextum]|nr:hypothetical protein LXA43DRAFT_621416 [Ganoderma leucocontextum]